MSNYRTQPHSFAPFGDFDARGRRTSQESSGTTLLPRLKHFGGSKCAVRSVALVPACRMWTVPSPSPFSSSMQARTHELYEFQRLPKQTGVF
jgi:hypothetical protein